MIHFDERGLGFYALGASQGGQIPSALIVTSGTAIGNLLPAIMEAHHSATPLIVLTADRPPEQLLNGANQSTDQLKIFQNFVRGQIVFPCAAVEVSESYVRNTIAHAVAVSKLASGPVHINWHIREPLFIPPFPSLVEGKPIPHHLPKKEPSSSMALSGRGVILIGRLSSPRHLAPILKLAHTLRWPIWGDLLSQARLFSTPEQIRYFDSILDIGAPPADTVLHFGERMTSKKSLNYLAKRHIHVSPFGYLQDPEHRVTERVIADPDLFCAKAELSPAPEEWLEIWKSLDQNIGEILDELFRESSVCTEAHLAHVWGKYIAPDWALFLGNSMAIREADHFLFPLQGRGFYANRGLSGIDGNIAAAAALSNFGPTALWIGDQAALHDLNSFSLLSETPHPLTLVVSNNFGGGIFSHLGLSGNTPHFERLFANNHSWQFEQIARMFNLPYYKVDTLLDFFSAWERSQKRSSVIEFVTSRTDNYAFHEIMNRTLAEKIFDFPLCIK